MGWTRQDLQTGAQLNEDVGLFCSQGLLSLSLDFFGAVLVALNQLELPKNRQRACPFSQKLTLGTSFFHRQ